MTDRYDSFFETHFTTSPHLNPVPFTLRKGDRLLLIGDSITEVRRYSLMLETYLAVCMPHLEVELRNIGKGGETAEGFLSRIDTECLNYKPTAATICYGMNDAGYLNNNREGAGKFRTASAAIVKKLKATGARVVLASHRPLQCRLAHLVGVYAPTESRPARSIILCAWAQLRVRR